jgi:pyruvate-ferredoxin/flavodoxin oxidoreductase
MSMSGLRASNFSSGQGIAYMHESLYGAVGKRLPYILNIGCRAITKTTLNVHAGHDDYHLMDDTGFFQVMGKNAQEAADLNIISRKIAELSLTPGAVGQDGFLTTHLIETLNVPRARTDRWNTSARPTTSSRPRPRPRRCSTANPPPGARSSGTSTIRSSPVTGPEPGCLHAVGRGPAALLLRPHRRIADQCMLEFTELTGRPTPASPPIKCEDADYLIIGQGSVIGTAEAVADYLRKKRGIKVGVVNMTMFRPFPGDLIGQMVKGRKGVVVLERTDQPLAEDLPLIREIRATLSKCIENGMRAKATALPEIRLLQEARRRPPSTPAVSAWAAATCSPRASSARSKTCSRTGRRRSSSTFRSTSSTTSPRPRTKSTSRSWLEGISRRQGLAVKGSENPNLLPKGAVTVRMHSVGGWGAITTGKNLAITLNDLLGYDIKANPKYGSEKKGQPTTYYLSAAPEPIRINCEYFFVDAVLSPDPNVFSHSNPLFGLKKGRHLHHPERIDDRGRRLEILPGHARKYIIDNEIKVCYLDAFKIAREEATDPELQFRMQGIAFQGAFFAGSTLMKTANLTEESLFKAIRDQVTRSSAARAPASSRTTCAWSAAASTSSDESRNAPRRHPGCGARRRRTCPIMLKRMPASTDPKTDIHRFWEQTGSFYLGGSPTTTWPIPSCHEPDPGQYRRLPRHDADPLHPPGLESGELHGLQRLFHRLPGQRHPRPGLHDQRRLRDGHQAVSRKRATKSSSCPRPSAPWKRRCAPRPPRPKAERPPASTSAAPHEAIDETIAEANGDKRRTQEGIRMVPRGMGEFKFCPHQALLRPAEKQQAGTGGLFAITINPYTCKGCMLCVDVCDDDALSGRAPDGDSVKNAAVRVGLLAGPADHAEGIHPHRRHRRKDRRPRDHAHGQVGLQSMACGDGACTGCGEKTILHIFTGTITALMQRRVQKHVNISMSSSPSSKSTSRASWPIRSIISDLGAIQAAVASQGQDLKLAELAGSSDEGKAGTPLDQEWLKWISGLLAS